MNKEHMLDLSQTVTVDRWCGVKLADLYRSPREWVGAVYVAPMLSGWPQMPPGVLSVYATINGGDPIMLAQIEGGEITWLDDAGAGLMDWAEWHRSEGYCHLVEMSFPR